MNAVYRGVDNPIAVSVAGVPSSDLIVSGPGLTGSNGNYTMDVTRHASREAVINVKYKDVDGTIKEAGSQPFRVYGLPDASPTLNGAWVDDSPIPKNTLAGLKVGASYKDFVYDLPLTVSSFEVVIPGKDRHQCQNGMISQPARDAIKNSPRNTLIFFSKIKALSPKGGNVEVADFVVEIL
jgi:hypothetical protein